MIWKSAKSDREDMEAAQNVAEMVEALGDRQTLQRFLVVCAVVNLFIWIVAVVFADWVYFVMAKVITDKVGMLILGVPLGLGMCLSYCLFRLKLPEIEDNTRLEADMMASFTYQADSSKRWMVWIFSVIGGVVNLALLILANVFFADQL